MSKYQTKTKNVFFPDQKEPEEGSLEFTPYWKKEKDRCINGFYLADGQVYISGWLYTHCVYGKIAAYIENPKTGRKKREIITPYLRDIEWIVAGDVTQCEEEGRFYDLVGSRDFGKSIIAASIAGRLYTFFDNSEAVITAGADSYIKLATDKIEEWLTNIHPMWKKKRLASDWKKEVRAGWKDKQSNQPDPKSSNSRIIMRNYESGNNTMAANGTRGGFHLIDEIGTLPNLIGCVKDSDGCWWSGDGDKPSCLTMLTGCVCAGTKVWTAEGKLINIEDLAQEDGILGYNGSGIFSEEISKFNPPAKKLCYKITTSGGNTIECSNDHPFLFSSRDRRTQIGQIKNVHKFAFKNAEDLKIGEYLARIEEVPVFGSIINTNARLMGLMLGDGYMKGSTLSLDDENVYEYIKENYPISVSKQFPTKDGNIYRSVYIRGVKSIFREAGIYHLTKQEKRLPELVHSLNKTSISEIIAGLFDSDGNVYYNKKKDTTRVVLTNISIDLLEDVKFQLLKFGIHSSIYKEKRNIQPSEEYKGQLNYIYRLYISKDRDVQTFKDNIPILHTKKVNTLNKFKRGKRDFGSPVAEFRLEGLTKDELFIADNSPLTNYRFESVTNIECIGEKDVYNLSTTITHTYIANGFITHNTGGDMEVGAEAAEIFFNPDAYNMLSFENPEGGRQGRFIDALMAKMAYKEPVKLSEYLGIPHPDLDNIIILITNRERAYEEWWLPQYQKALKSGNSKAIMKFKAYWPLKSSDSFLVLTKNDYNVEAAREQQKRLKLKAQETPSGFIGSPVELYNDGEKITHRFSEKLPLTEFPAKTQSTDCPIIIYEFPIVNAPWGQYIAGIDPYRHDKADNSDSLGAVYIFKRQTLIAGEDYQDMFVASFAARPEKQEQWNEQAWLLIKWYNAFTFCENDEMSFIRYVQNKGDDYLLADVPQWLKDQVPFSTAAANRDKGVHSSVKTISFYRGRLKNYLDETVYIEKDKEQKVIKEHLGVTKIPDIMLLEEIIRFNKDGNFDRERAASICIAAANKMEPIGKVEEKDDRIESLFKKNKKGHTMFTRKTSLFKNRKPGIFR